MRRIALVGVLSGAVATVVPGPSVAKPVAPPQPAPSTVRPPDIMGIVEHNGPGYTHYDLVTYAPDGAARTLLDKLPVP